MADWKEKLADSFGGLSGKVVAAKKKRLKELEEAAGLSKALRDKKDD